MSAEKGRVEPAPDAFAFGENWQRYITEYVTPERERIAADSLVDLLEVDLAGKTFLDVGCGSGLFSLAAHQAGARQVISIDIDQDSVAATETLRRRSHASQNWRVIHGSILDQALLDQLPTADVVYSWGVLHHTGEMETGIRNASRLVAEGGLFCIAIYNRVTDRYLNSERWRRIKRRYNQSGRPAQVVMEWLYTLYWAAAEVARRRNNPLRTARDYKTRRGMALRTDLVDWLGGYPYEFATAEEVVRFCEDECGLAKRKVVSVGPRDLGNNEFLFERPV